MFEMRSNFCLHRSLFVLSPQHYGCFLPTFILFPNDFCWWLLRPFFIRPYWIYVPFPPLDEFTRLFNTVLFLVGGAERMPGTANVGRISASRRFMCLCKIHAYIYINDKRTQAQIKKLHIPFLTSFWTDPAKAGTGEAAERPEVLVVCIFNTWEALQGAA